MRPTSSLAAFNAAVLACGVLALATVGAPGDPALAPAGQDDAPSVTSAPAAEEPVVQAEPTPKPAAVAAPPAVRKAPAAAPTTKAPAPAPARRAVVRTGWAPYATAGPVTLHFPGDVVEVVGLHESGHDGAQPQLPVKGPARIGLMDSRSRDTHGQGAADIVVDPTREVRAPVTGTVIRAGSYTLYCDHTDDYLVVEPDARPGWEVKLLHFEGLRVAEGDRVEGGVTVVGSRARVLPFASQVDKHTVAPHWPHLHVEVVDPTIKDRPSGRSCD